MEEVEVIIVGAGPSGLATSACLSRRNISNIVLEREECCGSLWKKRSYDRVKLHLAKQFCELPHVPYPKCTPQFVPKNEFIQYLDNYVSHFGITPSYLRTAEAAIFDVDIGKWRVAATNTGLGVEEVYYGEFLVVATGENSEGYIPVIKGFESFRGVYMHSSSYVNGDEFEGKDVLVVGSGNSGMEIAFDLTNWKAKTSICVRGPVHVLTKEIVLVAMFLLQFFPVKLIDIMAVALGKLKYGNLSKFGLPSPKKGPFFLKATTGRSATIDVGCVEKIKAGEVTVFPSITSIEGNEIKFENGKIDRFDAIIFATGYRSTDKAYLFDDSGMPKESFPNHWKGKNGLYCAGFARRGLLGISDDAENIAKDISIALNKN
ncbi:Pyridine nucleotide-disulfide oxidoreductase, class-II [Parasponia andersonii]|uniref:Flavin-containing monooxygenase n=1 Tax=Parasponia andersonii TaxID=3476 RepID=A0A2P5A674_PARAD|nr:Pyridine nucleotide-disulfide oxidoreductase, class-II [Parasponia andersonii]